MLAANATNGCLYSVPRRGQRRAYDKAECHGWNHSKEFVLFLVFDEFRVRKMIMVFGTEEIQAL